MKKLLIYLFPIVCFAQDYSPMRNNFAPVPTNTFDLGRSSLRWDSIYVNYYYGLGTLSRGDSIYWNSKLALKIPWSDTATGSNNITNQWRLGAYGALGGTNTWTGANTFNLDLATHGAFYSGVPNSVSGGVYFYDATSSHTGLLTPTGLTADRQYLFPNLGGTVLLNSSVGNAAFVGDSTRIAMTDKGNTFTRAQYLDTLRGRTGVIQVDSAIHGNRGFEFVSPSNGDSTEMWNNGMTYSPSPKSAIMWLPFSAALRGGGVSGTQWDLENIGTYSFSWGANNIASSQNAVAFGNANKVIGYGSIAVGSFNYLSNNWSAAFGTEDTLKGYENYSMGYKNLSDSTYQGGYGNWLFGQCLHVKGRGVWAFGSDDSFEKRVIPFSDAFVWVGEPAISWSTVLGVNSTRLSTSYQSPKSIDSIRYGQYYTLRASGGYASFDIGSQRQFTVSPTTGNLGNAFYHTYLSFNYDSLQGIVFNPTKTDAQGYGNVQIANGGLTMGGVTLDSAITTSSTQGAHIGGGLLVGGNASIGGTLTIGGGPTLSKFATGSRVYDCGSIAAGIDSTFSVTCTGAVAGNPVQLGVSVAAEAGLIFTAECTTNDAVTVRISNHFLVTAVDPASRTYKILVTNF